MPRRTVRNTRPTLLFSLLAAGTILAGVVFIQQRSPFLECRKREIALEWTTAQQQFCKTDADCVPFPVGCGANGDCPLAVSASTLERMREDVDTFRTLCGKVVPACGACAAPRCVGGICSNIPNP